MAEEAERVQLDGREPLVRRDLVDDAGGVVLHLEPTGTERVRIAVAECVLHARRRLLAPEPRAVKRTNRRPALMPAAFALAACSSSGVGASSTTSRDGFGTSGP